MVDGWRFGVAGFGRVVGYVVQSTLGQVVIKKRNLTTSKASLDKSRVVVEKKKLSEEEEKVGKPRQLFSFRGGKTFSLS